MFVNLKVYSNMCVELHAAYVLIHALQVDLITEKRISIGVLALHTESIDMR